MKRHLRAAAAFAPLVGFWIAMAAYYLFVVSAGHLTRWPAWTAYYDAQTRALLHGHLHLLEPPSRALMALKDPYDIANMPYWRWDHTYYRGHLYTYWGMVPAFIGAAVTWAFGGVTFGDNALAFTFSIVRLVAGTLLIRWVARRAAPRPPRWAVALGMLVFALAHPTPYTLARPAVYEAAILGGVAFILLGICFGFRSVRARGDRAALAWLAAAGLCFGLAGGCRITVLPTGAALAALTAAWHAWRSRQAGRPRLLAPAVAALAPVGAVGLGLLALNKLRFDAWTEFGVRYTLTYPKPFLGLRFLLPDLYAHAFAPPRLSCTFPYLTTAWDALRVSAPDWLQLPWPADNYAAEPILGLLVVTPFVWFAVAAALAAIARWRVRRASTLASPPGIAPARPLAWIDRDAWLWAALIIWVAGAAPLLILNVTTMRYQHDFFSALLLIAIFGGWRLLGAPARPAARRAIAGVYVLLAALTIVAGVLLGFTGYFKHFERNNPALLHRLQDRLSVCAGK